MTKDEALRLALEALEKISRTQYHIETPPIESLEEKMRRIADKAITAIKAALEAKGEPVACINVEQRKLEWAKYVSWGTPTVVNLPKIPLYTTPPQRTWVGLTDDDRFELAKAQHGWEDLLIAAEAKLKEKNT
jgi:hypothetical protein